jgi:hypothetical protein
LPKITNYLKELREKKIFKNTDDWERIANHEEDNDKLLKEVYKIEKVSLNKKKE